MAFHRRKGGLDIRGVGSSRGPRKGRQPRPKAHLFTKSQARSERASQRAALSRAAKGRDTYIHPSGYGRREQRFTRKGILTFIAVLVVAIALAVGAGYFVYQQAAKNALKPVLNTEALNPQLSDAKSEMEPEWSVMVHTDAASAEGGRGTIVDMALVCLDPDNVSLTILWIPPNTRVYIDGYGYGEIAEAFAMGGEADLTVAVEKLAGLEVQHYIEFNNAGLRKLENLLAPLSVDVDNAGRDQIAYAICKKLFGSSSEQISTMVEDYTTCIATSASSDEVKREFRAIHGINMDTSFFTEDMPATLQSYDGVEYSICNKDQWNTMVTRVASGMSPVASAAEVDTNKVIRENCTVTVWNGVGVSGVANDCANELRKQGWNVIHTGNANQFIYDETFIVFKNTDDEAAARLLAADLGQGRVVRSYARYSYTGNLLVVVGKDYKPY